MSFPTARGRGVFACLFSCDGLSLANYYEWWWRCFDFAVFYFLVLGAFCTYIVSALSGVIPNFFIVSISKCSISMFIKQMICAKMIRGRQSTMTNYARCYFSSGSLRSRLLIETDEVQDLIAENDSKLRIINASWYLPTSDIDATA